MSNIDYDLGKIKAFAFGVDEVLSCDVTPLRPDGDPVRTVSIKDNYALQLAVKKGYEVAIITGGYTEVAQIRFSRLGIRHIYMRSAIKVHSFKDSMEKTGLSPKHVMCAGDDIPDYEVVTQAGLSVVPADTAPEIKEVAKYISSWRGGEDVARGVIEQTMRTQRHWLGEEAFRW